MRLLETSNKYVISTMIFSSELSNSKKLQATQEGYAGLTDLYTQAIKMDTLPHLWFGAILSLGDLCNDRCTVNLT